MANPVVKETMYLVKSGHEVYGRVDTMPQAKGIVEMHKNTKRPGGIALKLEITREEVTVEDTSKWPERYCTKGNPK